MSAASEQPSAEHHASWRCAPTRSLFRGVFKGESFQAKRAFAILCKTDATAYVARLEFSDDENANCYDFWKARNVELVGIGGSNREGKILGRPQPAKSVHWKDATGGGSSVRSDGTVTWERLDFVVGGKATGYAAAEDGRAALSVGGRFEATVCADLPLPTNVCPR